MTTHAASRQTLLTILLAVLLLATPAAARPLPGHGEPVAQVTAEQLVHHYLGAPHEVVSITGGPGGIISGL